MLRRYKPLSFVKTVAVAGTPEYLGNNDLRLYGMTFIAEKAVGTNNVGNVTIQIDGAAALILEPGEMYTWPQPPFEAGYFMPEDFKIDVATAGDGVRCLTNILL